jgi:hypothetical protein
MDDWGKWRLNSNQMNEMNPLDVNLSSVSIFSLYAVSAAHRYVNLVEGQLSRAHDEMLSTALEEYRRITNPDETDYDNYVIVVDRFFEEDYQPILRFTEVTYLYMIFETYTSSHIDEIQALRKERRDILKRLKNRKNNLVAAIQHYFQEQLKWSILSDEEWNILLEIAEVRNCIVHYAGVARDCKKPERIDSLESRQWQGQSIGIQIDRYQGKDVGQPIIIHRQFPEFFLDLLERYFNNISQETHVNFWNKK